MMKNNIFLNLRAGIISLLFLMLIAASCESESNSKSFLVEPADTIVLPANTFGNFKEFYQPEKEIVQYQLYPAVGNGMEVIFFNPDDPDDYNSYRFDSIRKLDPQKYICANAMEMSKNHAIINFLWESEFFKIKADGIILDTINIYDKRENRNEYSMYWFMNMSKIPKAKNQVFLRANKKTNRKSFNANSQSQRIEFMKNVGIGVIADIKDTSIIIEREIGEFPEIYFSKKEFVHVWPEFIINKDAELLYYFQEIDSLFVTDIEHNSTKAYPLNIFYKKTPIISLRVVT